MYRNVVSSLARKGFLAAVILLSPHLLHAASVSLAWDRAASHTNLSSFVLKYGVSSGSYTGQVVVATNVTTATVNTLVAGVRYYFAVTARNVAGLESDPSNEISFTPASTAPNVLPTLNLLSNVAVAEDSPQQSIALAGISAGVGDLLQTLSVSATSSNPSLIPMPTVSYTSPNTTGTLRFAPVANASGTATITVRVNDGGLVNNLLSRTFLVTVNAVNDPPTLNGLSNLSLNANAGPQSVSLSGIGSGAANETQALTVSATSSNPSLIPTPTVSYSSPGTTGVLRFTPVANAAGTATVTVRVNDGQAQNNLVTRTFVVTVHSAANRPPTLNSLANVAISEDAGWQTINLAGIGSGSTTEVQPLTVTATSSNPALIPTPTVSYTSPNTTGTLRFAPVANASGTATITVRVNDGGLVNNLLSRTFLVTVNAVNDPPTLNGLSNLSLNANAGPQSVSLSGIGSGAANETQALTVSATSSNPSLIPTPTVSYSSPGTTGVLRFTPVANAAGTATVTVRVNDGQAQNNLVTRTFVVTVHSAANRPPTLNSLANVAISEDAGWQTINLAGIGSGSTTEVQPLTVTATSSNPALIPTPTVSYTSPNTTGTLRFAPVANASGTATITVRVNDGQAQSNIITRSFLVTVNAVNDAPTLNPLTSFSLNMNSGQRSVSLSGIGSGATNEFQTLKVTAMSSNRGLIPDPVVSYTSPGAMGSLRFTPVANATGTSTITVTVTDGQTQNGAVTRSFVVTVAGTTSQTLYVQAESGSRTLPMTLGVDGGAANSQYIYSTIANQGTVSLPFTASVTASYHVWCRVMAPDNGRDSFFFKVDNGVEEIFPTAPQGSWSGNWQWVKLNVGGVAKVLPLSPGSHTLVFRCREAFSYLDAVYITSDPGFTPPVTSGSIIAAAGAPIVSVTEENLQPVVDSAAPEISDLEVIGSNARSLTLHWHTDEPVRSRIDFGTNAFLDGGSVIDSDLATDHTLSLPGLVPGTDYLIRVRATDESGNESSTEIGRAGTSSLAEFMWSAEEGTFAPPLRVWTSRNAEGGKCVSSVADVGTIAFPVDVVTASDYTLWCRMRSPGRVDPAYQLFVDGEEIELAPVATERTGFKWRWVRLAQRPLSMAAGIRELRLESLPAGFALDEFVLTNDPDWVPADPVD